MRYAEDTWASFEAMINPDSGLPTDRLHIDGSRVVQTSTSNIGVYLWAAIVAGELGIIHRDEMLARLSHTVGTLEAMERHDESGLFYNWYDYATGEVLTVWPPSGQPREPRLSSVDNGWLATGLQIVRNHVPELEAQAGALYDAMDFGIFYVPEENLIARSYFPATGELPCCYGALGETRIASYLGIGNGQIPRRQYFGPWRTMPDTCDFAFSQYTKPIGSWRSYLGVDVFEGAYEYRGTYVVPNWGGSMFEALMVPLIVPEEVWAPRSWRINHPRFVQGQIAHGLEEAQYGYWGFSPADVPEGGYRHYGVPGLGLNRTASSNADQTIPDPGFAGCEGREPQPLPEPDDYTNGVVTPHAAFLALRWAPDAVLENLANLERDFDIYTDWGFRDSVNVQTGTVAEWYLSLDQGMIMAAIGNHLADDVLRDAFVTPRFEGRLRPVMAMEEYANFRLP
jgi:hypothetical protein